MCLFPLWRGKSLCSIIGAEFQRVTASWFGGHGIAQGEAFVVLAAVWVIVTDGVMFAIGKVLLNSMGQGNHGFFSQFWVLNVRKWCNILYDVAFGPHEFRDVQQMSILRGFLPEYM